MKGRKLPTFEIEGTLFLVDLNGNRFLEVGSPMNQISFDSLGCHPHGFFLLYDKSSKKAWTGDKLKLPAHVVKVFVPFPYKLDPIGLARKQGFPDDYYTREPPQNKKKR